MPPTSRSTRRNERQRLIIDAFNAAWFEPWIGLINEIGWPGTVADHDWLSRLNRLAEYRAIRNSSGLPIQFIASAALAKPHGGHPMAYEAGIAESGRVPTRVHGESAWHDYFNALVWLEFPMTKAAINQRQSEVIATEGVSGERGPLRDALTLFDESAILFSSQDRPDYQDLRDSEWRRLFVERRNQFERRTRCWVIGHALLQKLLRPYKAICGHALFLGERSDVDSSALAAERIPVPAFDLAADRADVFDAGLAAGIASVNEADLDSERIEWDRAASAVISASSFGKEKLTPLPILGIPGWWPANEQAEFYNDLNVFRRRQR